jgi:hypothetical protein
MAELAANSPAALGSSSFQGGPMILGLSYPEHDSAATLLTGGNSIAAIEEDKLSRVPTFFGSTARVTTG